MARDQLFLGATAKLMIASVDVMPAPDDLVVKAQYNPKDLQVTQPIGWTEQENLAGQHARNTTMEFGGMKSSSMQVELLFDGAEHGGRIGKNPSDPYVVDLVAKLKKLASVRDPDAPLEEMWRPHFCLVTWGVEGTHNGNMRPFRCVIESLTTKYLMFARDGRVLRALCTVGLKEADRVQLLRPKARARRSA